jgi:hypothetical protein
VLGFHIPLLLPLDVNRISIPYVSFLLYLTFLRTPVKKETHQSAQ